MPRSLHLLSMEPNCPEETFDHHWHLKLRGLCQECAQEEENRKLSEENKPLDSQGSTHPFNKHVL